MNSRERILANIKKNLPNNASLPSLNFTPGFYDCVEKFKTVLTGIGGQVIEVKNWNEIKLYIENNFKGTDRIISLIPHLDHEKNSFDTNPHLLESVVLAILRGHFAVAESGAIWITETNMGDRALPFIAEHLALVVNKTDIVETLHEAYQRIGASNYEMGTFIAGPSKTADIEQSLVLGAHGAKSLVVFLLDIVHSP